MCIRYMGILIAENSFVVLEIFDVPLTSLLPAVPIDRRTVAKAQ